MRWPRLRRIIQFALMEIAAFTAERADAIYVPPPDAGECPQEVGAWWAGLNGMIARRKGFLPLTFDEDGTPEWEECAPKGMKLTLPRPAVEVVESGTASGACHTAALVAEAEEYDDD